MNAAARILHLAPHLGGGVGTVVRALIGADGASRPYLHSIACLEELNAPTRRWAEDNGVDADDRLWSNPARLNALLEQADIVQMHWWHHPLLNAFMHRRDLPPFRCALWSHVNGLYPPQNLPRAAADYADQLVLATPASLELPFLRDAQAQRFRVIRSNAGPPALSPRPRSQQTLRIGYIGTVDPAKMHPGFVTLSLAAGLEDARFIVAGGPGHHALQRQIDACGASDRFEVRGPVADAGELMVTLDVFGYPLTPQHYGSGEQVLIEAMTAGAVPVVLDNSCERHIVEHERNGLVCADEQAYVRALQRLHADRDLLRRLSQQAQRDTEQRFSLQQTVHEWHAVYEMLLKQPRRPHAMTARETPQNALSLLNAALGDTAAGPVFASILNGDTPELAQLPPACFAATRGSPFHYRRFFPDDPGLSHLCDRLSILLQKNRTIEVTS